MATRVGATDSTVWMTDEPASDRLNVLIYPDGQPERKRPLASVIAMSQGGFQFDSTWRTEGSSDGLR